MRDPINFEPMPYTGAAILVSPTPAARMSAKRHVDEWLYTEMSSLGTDDLITRAQRTTLYGRSLTDCHVAGCDPLHDFVENLARRGNTGRKVAELILEIPAIAQSRKERPAARTPTPKTGRIRVYYPTSAADAEAFYKGLGVEMEERRRREAA